MKASDDTLDRGTGTVPADEDRNGESPPCATDPDSPVLYDKIDLRLMDSRCFLGSTLSASN